MREIKSTEIGDFIGKIRDEWALLGAGTNESRNSMTVSWGGIGHLWRKDVAYAYVRPTRYTYEFMEREDYFVFTFLKDGNRENLSIMGTKSGRENKIEQTTLTPIMVDGHPTFEQAKLVIVCKKAYVSDIKREEFVDKTVEAVYTDDNIHRQYIGVIEKVYIND